MSVGVGVIKKIFIVQRYAIFRGRRSLLEQNPSVDKSFSVSWLGSSSQHEESSAATAHFRHEIGHNTTMERKPRVLVESCKSVEE